MNRRDLIKGTLAAGAALAVPARLPAQVRKGLPRDAKLVEIAKQAQAKAKSSNLLWREDFVGIADYGLRSSEPRFHFVNLAAGEVKSYHVTHGDGSDPEHDGWLNWYSNKHGSHCTSKGTYATFGWYTGRYGTSIRLEGLDDSNSNALGRAIVMHRAKYAEPEHLKKWGRLGRSNGCFAMSNENFKLALLQLGGGRVIHADSFGLMPDGSVLRPRTTEPPANLKILSPPNPTGMQRLNPGAF